MSASWGGGAPAAESINVETAAPSRMKRVSLFHYSPALIFIVIVVADTTRLADPDLWGHVRFGQDVLAQRHLIFYDHYSYSAPGHLWLNHEWLSEVLMALGVTFIQTPRSGDIALISIAALMIAAAFLAVRNLPLAVIATVAPLARHTALALEARRERLGLPPAHAKDRSPTINQLIVAVAAFELLILTGLFSKKMAADDPYPVGAISYMKQHRLSGNILADFQWGEYVIWHMPPASKVFIDGRYDTVYPPRVIDDYLPFTNGEIAGKEILVNYPHDFVLVGQKNDPAYKLVNAQSGWKQIYRDDSCVLFARDTSAAAKLAPITVPVKDTPENSFP